MATKRTFWTSLLGDLFVNALKTDSTPLSPLAGFADLEEPLERLRLGSSLIDAELATLPEHRRLDLLEACTAEEVGLDLATLQGWVDADPRPMAVALLAQGNVRDGWVARGNGVSSTITPDGAQTFLTLTERGDELATEALGTDPNSILAHRVLNLTTRALNLPADVAQGRYDAALASAPWDYDVVYSRLQYLAPKWHGTKEEMFDFARATTRDAPEGSPAVAAIALAWIETKLFKRITRFAVTDKVGAAELTAAARKLAVAPLATIGIGHRAAASAFIMVLDPARAEHREVSAPLFEILGDEPTPWPFGYVSAPRAYLAQCRKDLTSVR